MAIDLVGHAARAGRTGTPPTASMLARPGGTAQVDPVATAVGRVPVTREQWTVEVLAALDRLPDAEGRVLRLAYVERLTYRRIAHDLGLREREVTRCAAAALHRLSTLLFPTSADWMRTGAARAGESRGVLS